MLIKRNLLMFFRDKAAVFFSLLSVFIIIALYALFLGDTMEKSLAAELGFASDKISAVVASLTFGGMIAVTSVTACLGALGISVEDKKNAAKDFHTSPVSRKKLLAAYLLGSGVVGIIMTITALVICTGYIVQLGGSVTLVNIVLLLITAALSVLCGNSMVYFASIFIESRNAYTSLCTVLGTLIGFIMGIYIPVGTLPEYVQWVIRLFPMTHAASMFKQILADDKLTELFANAPPEMLQAMREYFGVVLTYGDYESSFWFSAAVLVVTAILFYGASLLVMKYKLKE